MPTVVLDPGHTGNYNPGVCPGYYEGNQMLKLAQFLGNDLRAMGVNVLYTRTTNAQNPSLEERGRLAAGGGRPGPRRRFGMLPLSAGSCGERGEAVSGDTPPTERGCLEGLVVG